MKKILLIALAAMFLAGCTEKTNYGQCVGIADERDPALIYKLDVWNAALGIIFVETGIVPVVVLANETFCPVGLK
jgi:PBP1b-binding outer membrane lipoprotein LpoB